MPFTTKDQLSAEVRLLTDAIRAINHEAKIEMMMYENRIDLVTRLIETGYDIKDRDDMDEIFSNQDIPDDLKLVIQMTFEEMQELRQARNDLNNTFNHMLNEARMRQDGR